MYISRQLKYVTSAIILVAVEKCFNENLNLIIQIEMTYDDDNNYTKLSPF